MLLHTYLNQERGRQSKLAKMIGAHAPDVCKWADGSRPVPIHFGAPIEAATDRMVTRQELFPNDWQKIWPELVSAKPRRTKSISK